jgi:hypothetical protein
MDTPDATKTPASVRTAFLAQAAKEGCVAPEDALALAGELAVTVDDAGRITGLTEAIAAVRTKRPWLFAPKASPGLDRLADTSRDPADQLRREAEQSGTTRDIQRWREARRR